MRTAVVELQPCLVHRTPRPLPPCGGSRPPSPLPVTVTAHHAYAALRGRPVTWGTFVDDLAVRPERAIRCSSRGHRTCWAAPSAVRKEDRSVGRTRGSSSRSWQPRND